MLFAYRLLTVIVQGDRGSKKYICNKTHIFTHSIELLQEYSESNLKEEIDLAILGFLLSIVRDDQDSKRELGEHILPFMIDKMEKAAGGRVGSERYETKFFKLMNVLTKNCNENLGVVFAIKGTIEAYKKISSSSKLKKKIITIWNRLKESDI